MRFYRGPFSIMLLCLGFSLSGCGGKGGSSMPTPVPPSAPTNLTATPGNAQVSLSWTAPTGATSYNVQRSSNNGGPYIAIATEVTATTYVDTGVTNGTTYYYIVQAVNSVGTSLSSSQASATPQAPPATPNSLVALPGNALVSLSWSASSGATTYIVLRSTTSGGPYTAIATSVPATSYSDATAANGTTYYYVVQAMNVGGTSANSNQVSARPSGELQARVAANQQAFYVYKDADSGFNHGFASGWFANPISNLSTISLDAGCVDDPADTTTGCYPSTDTSALDTLRGTVLRLTFAAQAPGDWAGVNIEEPEHWGVLQTGYGYDLSGAQNVVFDVRSPDMGTVQFGVGECVTQGYQQIPQNWETVTIPLSSLVPPLGTNVSCPPTLDSVHVLFTVVTDSQNAPNGATVLLDNIQFTPLPARATQTQEGETFSLPPSNQVFAVVAQAASPFPPDQANRNFAAIYEATLTIRVLNNQGDAPDAQDVANAIDYALYHDNQGDYLSAVPNGTSGCFSGAAATQCGLHDAYESGDIALLNAQGIGPGTAQAGDSRLAGFTCGTNFCVTQDTATGGNNAWAILALLDEYKASGDAKYLNDAITIGNWIMANLTDNTGTGFGGYYVGFSIIGQAPPKMLNYGKSTENNADIFIAFTSLANYDTSNAAAWTSAANVAGDFVMAMYDATNGRFNNGTDPVGTQASQPGLCPTGATMGNDVINTNSSPDCDFLDADTFTTLAMANSPRYFQYPLPGGGIMDWRIPVQYALNTFAQSITVGSQPYQGFDIVPNPLPAADGTVTNGIAWEFTGQMVETMRYVDQLYNQTSFESQAEFYLGQIQLAQMLAPFGDGQGLVASTLENGNTLPPVDQCLNTPFDNCPPERVGLAATSWMILDEQQFNPLSIP
jgi:fibronectin type III domain protein